MLWVFYVYDNPKTKEINQSELKAKKCNHCQPLENMEPVSQAQKNRDAKRGKTRNWRQVAVQSAKLKNALSHYWFILDAKGDYHSRGGN